jgi:hypothetical protein
VEIWPQKERSGESDPVNICKDSMSSLHALTSVLNAWGLVKEVPNSLNYLASKVILTLHWVAAHHGIEEDDAADDLAKWASEMRFVWSEPSLAVSVVNFKLAVRNWARKEHEVFCSTTKCCREYKLFCAAICLIRHSRLG